MGDWAEVTKEDLRFHLPYQCEQFDLDVEYVIAVAFDRYTQENWFPKVGQLICGSTGNIFVISGEHNLVQKLGGKKFFYGGSSCNRDGGVILNSTKCSVLTKDGLRYILQGGEYVGKHDYNYSSFDSYRWIPRPHAEINQVKFDQLMLVGI